MQREKVHAKKYGLLILIPLLLFSFCLNILALPAFAEETGVAALGLTASNLTPAVGDTITVKVDLSGNTGFAAIQFDVLYDTKVLSCTGASVGAILSSASLKAANPENDGRITVAAAALEEMTKDGEAAVITFKVKGPGDAKLGLEVVSLCDIDYIDLEHTISSDKVTVKSDDDIKGDTDTGTGGGTANSGDNNTSETNEQVFLLNDIANHWASKEIEKISSLGLITGFADGSFKPDNKMTRAQFAVILWRMAGQPEPKGTAEFTDLKADWYVKAVAWASENGYINGKGELLYSPDSNIKRQELAAILYRFSGGTPGMETLFYGAYDNLYTDSGVLTSWGRSAMYWAVYNEYMKGVTGTELNPDGQATRAQVAAIISRYLDSK